MVLITSLTSSFATITIISGEGKITYKEENISTSSPAQISLQEYSSGAMYVARVAIGNEIVYKKFVKAL